MPSQSLYWRDSTYYKRSTRLGEIVHLVVLEKVLLISHLPRSQEKTPSHSKGLHPVSLVSLPGEWTHYETHCLGLLGARH